MPEIIGKRARSTNNSQLCCENSATNTDGDSSFDILNNNLTYRTIKRLDNGAYTL